MPKDWAASWSHPHGTSGGSGCHVGKRASLPQGLYVNSLQTLLFLQQNQKFNLDTKAPEFGCKSSVIRTCQTVQNVSCYRAPAQVLK